MLQRLRSDSRHITKILGGVVAGLMALASAWTPALAQGKGGTLRIGMIAADIVNTAGIPDQGFAHSIGFRGRSMGLRCGEPLTP